VARDIAVRGITRSACNLSTGVEKLVFGGLDAGTDWRHSKRNVWKVEQYLIDLPHQDFKWSRASKARFKRLRAEYFERGPLKSGRHWW
jgi:hypothetical protein